MKYIGYWAIREENLETLANKLEAFKNISSDKEKYPTLLSENYCFCDKPEGFTLLESDCRAKLENMKKYYEPEVFFKFTQIREGAPKSIKKMPRYEMVWVEGMSRPIRAPIKFPEEIIE